MKTNQWLLKGREDGRSKYKIDKNQDISYSAGNYSHYLVIIFNGV